MPVSHTHTHTRACSRREREREKLFPAKRNFVKRSFKECLREEEDFFLLENVRQFIYFNHFIRKAKHFYPFSLIVYFI